METAGGKIGQPRFGIVEEELLGEAVAVDRTLGEDACGDDVGFDGIARARVEDVPVAAPTLLERALVEAARDERAVRDIRPRDDRRAALGERILDAHAPGGSIGFGAEHGDIAAEVHAGALHALADKVGDQRVGYPAFRDSAQVEGCSGIVEPYSRAFHVHGPPTHMGKGRLDILLRRYDAVAKIPERGYGTDGDIEKAVALLAVAERFGDKVGRLGLDHDGLASRIVDARDIARGDGPREELFKALAERDGTVEHLLVHHPAQLADRIEAEDRSRELLGGSRSACCERTGSEAERTDEELPARDHGSPPPSEEARVRARPCARP